MRSSLPGLTVGDPARDPHNGLATRTPLDAWMSDARRTVRRRPPGALWGWMSYSVAADGGDSRGASARLGRAGSASSAGAGGVFPRSSPGPSALVATAHAALLDQP